MRQLDYIEGEGLVEIVQQHQRVELNDLQSVVDTNTRAIEATDQEIAEVTAKLSELQVKRSAQETELNDSKSDLATATGLVERSASGTDTVADSRSESVEDATSEPVVDPTISSTSPDASFSFNPNQANY